MRNAMYSLRHFTVIPSTISKVSQTAVAFLCASVNKPNIYKYKAYTVQPDMRIKMEFTKLYVRALCTVDPASKN